MLPANLFLVFWELDMAISLRDRFGNIDQHHTRI